MHVTQTCAWKKARKKFYRAFINMYRKVKKDEWTLVINRNRKLRESVKKFNESNVDLCFTRFDLKILAINQNISSSWTFIYVILMINLTNRQSEELVSVLIGTLFLLHRMSNIAWFNIFSVILMKVMLISV